MTDLRPVKRAATTARRARAEYRRAMLEAHRGGATYADLGRAAGVSPQAARVIVERASRSQSNATLSAAQQGSVPRDLSE